jgi:hypothetical protein
MTPAVGGDEVVSLMVDDRGTDVAAVERLRARDRGVRDPGWPLKTRLGRDEHGIAGL